VSGVVGAEQDYLRERKMAAVRDGNHRAGGVQRLEAPRGATVKPELRRAGDPHDLDVAPQHPPGAPGAESLHRSFLGGKPSGEVRRRMASACRVRNLARREDTLQETVAESSKGALDTVDFRRIETQADDVHNQRMNLPKPSGPFAWMQEPWGPALRCLPLLAHARHVFTTRSLDLKGPAETTAANWRLVAASVGVSADRLARLRQVHGARVVEAETMEGTVSDDRPEADALVSRDPTVGLVVAAADCVPLLLVDARTGAAAAVHAGWRGTAAGAGPAAVAALQRAYGVRATDLVAAVGPSIGPCCYTVGPELPERFADHPDASSWFRRVGGLRLDLWRATRDQLLRAGLHADHVHISMLCTSCHADLLCSYRKDGATTGRMAGVIRPMPRASREVARGSV